MDLPTALIRALEASGLTRAQLYEKLGYTPDIHGGCPALSRWLTGRVAPDLPRIVRLATALGRPLRFEVDGAKVAVFPQESAESANVAAT